MIPASQMVKSHNYFLLLCLFLTSSTLHSEMRHPYRAYIRLPVDLYTAEGAHLVKSQYEMEVKLEQGTYVLAFLSQGEVRALVNGLVSKDDAVASAVNIPLMGTQFLRPYVQEEATDGDRKLSKTGRSQYEEQERDWNATLRAYRHANHSEALLVFQERQEEGEWSRVEFRLFLKPQ